MRTAGRAGSQLSALASPQSRPIESREWLERRVAELAERYADGEVPLPRLLGWLPPRRPRRSSSGSTATIACTTGSVYTPDAGGGWRIERLAPVSPADAAAAARIAPNSRSRGCRWGRGARSSGSRARTASRSCAPPASTASTSSTTPATTTRPAPRRSRPATPRCCSGSCSAPPAGTATDTVVSNKLWWEFWPEQSAAAELDGSLAPDGLRLRRPDLREPAARRPARRRDGRRRGRARAARARRARGESSTGRRRRFSEAMRAAERAGRPAAVRRPAPVQPRRAATGSRATRWPRRSRRRAPAWSRRS